MVSQITSRVEVKVETKFVQHSSDMHSGKYLFTYSIDIQNNNDFSIQLLSRHWKIQDSLSPVRFVNGEGVIGEQPILLPGESYQYQSYCDLNSSIGYMEGSYIFRKEDNQELIEVDIPRFELALLSKLN